MRAIELFDQLAEKGEDDTTARSLSGWEPLSVQLEPIGRAELVQYLRSLASVELKARAIIDDGRPGKTSRIGPVRADNGTVLDVHLGFERKGDTGEAELRTLSVKPSRPAKMLGPLLSFDQIELDQRSRLCFRLHVLGGSEEIFLESIHRDGEGALVFKVSGKGFLARLATDLRITRDRVVQYYSKGFLWLGVSWLGAGWKNLAIGDPVIVEAEIPIKSWPPRASELLDWLPEPKQPAKVAAGDQQTSQPAAAAQPIDIPVSDLSIHFILRGGRSNYSLGAGAVQLELSEHRVELESHGYFEGRTYRPHAIRPSKLTAKLGGSGKLTDPASHGRLERATVTFDGSYRATLPFDALEALELEASAEASVEVVTRELGLNLPDALSIEAPGEVTLSVATTGAVQLRPGDADPKRRYLFNIDRRLSSYSVSAKSQIQVRGLEPFSVGDKVLLSALETTNPLLKIQGLFGYEQGCFVARGEAAVALRSDTELTVRADSATDPSLKVPAGAWMKIDAVATAALEHAQLAQLETAFAAQLRGQLHTGGAIAELSVNAPGLEASVPGRAVIDARLNGEARYSEGELDLTRARLLVRAGVEDAPASVRADPENGPRLLARLAPGSWVQVDSGDAVVTAFAPLELSTAGQASGQRHGRLRTHLAVDRFEFQDRNVLLEIDRGTIIDLAGPVALRFAGASTPQFSLSCDATLELAYPPGDGVSIKPNKGVRLFQFGGPAKAKVQSVIAFEL